MVVVGLPQSATHVIASARGGVAREEVESEGHLPLEEAISTGNSKHVMGRNSCSSIHSGLAGDLVEAPDRQIVHPFAILALMRLRAKPPASQTQGKAQRSFAEQTQR